ncbi:MAG: hypothetical protein KAT25_05230 [Sulfuriflexus sp.]|nr:hypothetical protein [Sulfuriflexus sp.]
MTQIKYFGYGVVISLLLMLFADMAHSSEEFEVIAYADNSLPRGLSYQNDLSETDHDLQSQGVREQSVGKIITPSLQPVVKTEVVKNTTKRGPASREDLNKAGVEMMRRLFALGLMYSNTRTK